MSNIINNLASDIAYVELTHNHECRVDLRFSWIDDQLFLPLSFLDDDEVKAISLVLADSNVEIYSRGMMDYFVPYEWLQERRPDSAELLANIRKAAEPFLHKYVGNPCGVCSKGKTTEASNVEKTQTEEE